MEHKFSSLLLESYTVTVYYISIKRAHIRQKSKTAWESREKGWRKVRTQSRDKERMKEEICGRAALQTGSASSPWIKN